MKIRRNDMEILMTCEQSAGFAPDIAKKIAGLNCSGNRDHATSKARAAHLVGDTADGMTNLTNADAAASEMSDVVARITSSKSHGLSI